MRMRALLASLVLAHLLVGCGDGDDEPHRGAGCLTVDDEGRPVTCITHDGEATQHVPGGGAMHCSAYFEAFDGMKRVESCPMGAQLVGYCRNDMGHGVRQFTYHYEHDIDLELAAELYQEMCEDTMGTWHG